MNVRIPINNAIVTHTWKLREASRKIATEIYDKAYETGKQSAEEYANRYIADVFAVVCFTLYKDYNSGESRIIRFIARCMANSHDVLDGLEMPDGSAEVIKDRLLRMGIDIDKICDAFAADAELSRMIATNKSHTLKSDEILAQYEFRKNKEK